MIANAAMSLSSILVIGNALRLRKPGYDPGLPAIGQHPKITACHCYFCKCVFHRLLAGISLVQRQTTCRRLMSMPQDDPIEGTKHYARFTLPSGEVADGQFLLDGPQTGVTLYMDRQLSARPGDFITLQANLPGRGYLSFLKCILLGVGTSYSGQGQQIHQVRYEASFYPHFVTLGSHAFFPDSRIRRLSVVVDDFDTIYYDFDAFGFDVAPEEHIGQILETFESRIARRVEVGDRPSIAYFTGRTRLLSANAPFGHVTARHQPSLPFGGGPKGVSISNAVMTDLDFDPPATFDQAIDDNLQSVLRFLELIAGRRQNLLHTELELAASKDSPGSTLKVFWAAPPNRPTVTDERRPQPADLPLNGGVEPTAFASVLERWLAADHARKEARARFSDGFSKGNRYDVDRLVSSANMFDILPKNAVPLIVDLPEDLRKAKTDAQNIFKTLPYSIERDSILNALGRLGTATLKHKTRHRAQILLTEANEYFPDLMLVLEQAIDCRNIYVHGSQAKIDYRHHFFETVPFFTDSLEFVFAVSDLIEAGWSIKPWLQQPTSMSHAFGSYRVEYRHRLEVLKALLDNAAKAAPGL
jgi:hypothetical protein